MKVFRLVVLLISSGILSYNAGPMKAKALWSVLVLWTSSISYWQVLCNDKLNSGTFIKTFIQIMGAVVIKVIKGNGIYTLVIPFCNGQPINCFNFFEIHATFYPFLDRNELIYFVKFKFCFSIF